MEGKFSSRHSWQNDTLRVLEVSACSFGNWEREIDSAFRVLSIHMQCWLDHIAVAFPTKEGVQSGMDALVGAGGSVTKDFRSWPQGDGLLDTVPMVDRKYIANGTIGSVSAVFVCPFSKGDEMSRFVDKVGGGRPAIHHLGIHVEKIDSALSLLETELDYKRLSDIVGNDTSMLQVFMKRPESDVIVELIQRNGVDSTEFVDSNIAGLSASIR